MAARHIDDLIEEKARAGDGHFAIAYALLQMAAAGQEAARALDRLGMNNLSPGGPPGALEKLAMETARIATSLEDQSN